ncbi:MAG: LacI family DNA-binding transcriptional regulator [Xanthomonadales bacterium]|nr:LacI family DNA-binding transcriptional regulator [Xanthomonadales bacterium]
MGSGKTTSFDIAHRAGVSQATVSRALRNSPLVSPETRERIQRIARELNYQVDRSAAGLRSQTSHTLALLLFEDATTDNSQINPFFLSMLSNISRAAHRRKFDLLVSFQQMSKDWHYEYEASNRADGIILLGYGDYVSYTDKLAKLLSENAHFVIWGATQPGLETHAVGCDNHLGGRLATEHLVGLGRRHIAFLGETTDRFPEFKRRFEGHRDALAEAGLGEPELQLDAQGPETSGFEATRRLLESGASFDAIFAASDLIAIGAIRCLNKAGLRVPQDVSVVGFDDIHAARYLSPALTTVRQDTSAAAEMLVNKLLGMIEGNSSSAELLPPSLIVRGSCGGRDT